MLNRQKTSGWRTCSATPLTSLNAAYRVFDGAERTAHVLTLAIEHAMHDIEVELHHHLDPVERIAITRVLEQLADDVPNRRREPW